ncbi:Shedu immune nuclease family protein [Beijerinckia sp. L45]|uniref:Shedu immune nuclease family protein n=1 Tax=Beijerinckia sp. L45 TaxID=1641855 RepID=UPI00131DF282|nr:Shedu immune nuclease family protein [Beijerinckia sp. L45]
MDEFEERSLFFSRRADKAIVSKSFPDAAGQRLRIVSKVIDGQEGLKFAKVEGEAVLRVTASGRYAVKATFFEDDRHIKTLSIQRFSAKTGPLDRESFTLVGGEIDDFLHFVAGIKTMPLDDTGKMHLSDEALRQIVLNKTQAERLFADHQGLFLEIAQRENLQRDIVAVGYRRKQLERFESLLTDKAAFVAEQEALSTGPEGVWQAFFESNTWIFGYGLSYQFLSALDHKKLEQVVRGFDITGPGKRADGLLKTQGAVKSLCFVEIKRHNTLLLGTQIKGYRSGAWPPSAELVGGVAQVQATVQDAIERIGRILMPTDPDGDPTGELLFNVRPQSFLIVGNLAQFETEAGLNQAKVRSFELYRRSTDCPVILTFDELLARARFIIEQAEA